MSTDVVTCHSTPLFNIQEKVEQLFGEDEYPTASPRYGTGYGHQDAGRAPVNARFRKRVEEQVAWHEILQACGYSLVAGRQAKIPNKEAKLVQYHQPGELVFYIHCVYHNERIPSLCLTDRGLHCFGCLASGDKVDFVAGIMHLQSSQAIKRFFAQNFPRQMSGDATPKLFE